MLGVAALHAGSVAVDCDRTAGGSSANNDSTVIHDLIPSECIITMYRLASSGQIL